MARIPLLLLALLYAAEPLSAADNIRVERVGIEPNAEPSTLSASVQGYDVVDYLVAGERGQRMTIGFEADNPHSHFNVLPPGSTVSLFTGRLSGNHYEGILPADGDYRIRIYLTRAAARQNETAAYRVRIRLFASGASSKSTPTTE